NMLPTKPGSVKAEVGPFPGLGN
ncbi:uncharacterized protein METZ01_LOCUS329886, partial [marine metagenome]